MRNKICEELNKSDIGKVVNLCGWVDRRRDHGGVIFIDLRDHSGFMQITINPEDGETLFKQAEILRNETVIMVNGIVNERPKDSINKNILTGELELKVKNLHILNEIKNNLPFSSDINGMKSLNLVPHAIPLFSINKSLKNPQSIIGSEPYIDKGKFILMYILEH